MQHQISAAKSKHHQDSATTPTVLNTVQSLATLLGAPAAEPYNRYPSPIGPYGQTLGALLGTQPQSPLSQDVLPLLLLRGGVSENHAVQGEGLIERDDGRELQQRRQGGNGSLL